MNVGQEGHQPDHAPAHMRGPNGEFQHPHPDDIMPVNVGRPILSERPYEGPSGRPNLNQQEGRDDGFINSNRWSDNPPQAERRDVSRDAAGGQQRGPGYVQQDILANRQQAAPLDNQQRGIRGNDEDVDPDRKQDTVIGKGFTAAMRRGLNQAPKRESENLVLEDKDGGLVATLQRGFEGITGGIFTSKEEVLKQRGPVAATEYDSVPGDDIDQKVQYFASRLPKHEAGELMLYRISKGEYEIDGIRVRMEWQPRRTQCGRIQNQIIVMSTEHSSEQMPSAEPLHTYIQMCAGAKHQLERNTIIGQLPECERVSFAMDGPQPMLRDENENSRYNAMQVATEQARQREEHAREWSAKNPLPRGGSKLGRPQDLAERAEMPSEGAESHSHGGHPRAVQAQARRPSDPLMAPLAPNGMLSAHGGLSPAPAQRQVGPPLFNHASLSQHMILGGAGAPAFHPQPGPLPTRPSQVMIYR